MDAIWGLTSCRLLDFLQLVLELATKCVPFLPPRPLLLPVYLSVYLAVLPRCPLLVLLHRLVLTPIPPKQGVEAVAI